MFGLACLDGELVSRRPKKPEATSRKGLLLRLLRGCLGSAIRERDLWQLGVPFGQPFQVEPTVETRRLADDLFHELELRGLGHSTRSGGQLLFCKAERHRIPPEQEELLTTAGIPASHFGPPRRSRGDATVGGAAAAPAVRCARQAQPQCEVVCVSSEEESVPAERPGISVRDRGHGFGNLSEDVPTKAGADEHVARRSPPRGEDGGPSALSSKPPQRHCDIVPVSSGDESVPRKRRRRASPDPGPRSSRCSENARANAGAGEQVVFRRGQRWEDGDRVSTTLVEDVVEGPFLDASGVRVRLQHVLLDSNVRATCRSRTQSERIVIYARCQAPSCNVAFKCQYLLKDSPEQCAKTFTVLQFGAHEHQQAVGRRIWTPQQERDAGAFLEEPKGLWSAKSLTLFLRGKGHQKDSLPSAGRRRQWLKRQRGLVHLQVAKDVSVASTERSLEKWTREPPAQSAQLQVHVPFILTSVECFLPAACPLMSQVARRFRSSCVNIGVDMKMKVLRNGWGVSTVCILVKDGLRRTTFGRKTQPMHGMACTTRALPLVQAVMDRESPENYRRLFDFACSQWGSATSGAIGRTGRACCTPSWRRDASIAPATATSG